VMKELQKIGLLHEDCITASGRTLGRGTRRHPRRGGWPRRLPRRHAAHPHGGVVGLRATSPPTAPS
jgi:dihydroxy-acid dehydratase